MPQTSVRLHPLAVDSVKQLQARLLADHGVKATYEEIVGALVVGTTPPQASGMLVAFHRQAASRTSENITGG